MLVLIGSHAAKRHGLRCNPIDVDVVGSYDEVRHFVRSLISNPTQFLPIADGKKIVAKGNGIIIEAEIAWPGSLAEKLVKLVESDTKSEVVEFRGTPVWLPSLNVLYMLKMSHRFLKNSPHFNKTMRDIREMDSFIEPKHFVFYKEREAATYNYGHPKLNVKKDEFFKGDGVVYEFDHDSIHEAIKHLERPAYTYFKPVDSEVMCSREMFDLLPERIKLLAVLEECYVLALERSQIHSPETHRRWSFETALEKVCTSITSGWFREYAWNSYEAVLSLYDDNYTDRFWSAVDRGEVKVHGA